jgi:hypothetical protein
MFGRGCRRVFLVYSFFLLSFGRATEMEENTPYFVYREIVHSVFSLAIEMNDKMSPAQQKRLLDLSSRKRTSSLSDFRFTEVRGYSGRGIKIENTLVSSDKLTSMEALARANNDDIYLESGKKGISKSAEFIHYKQESAFAIVEPIIKQGLENIEESLKLVSLFSIIFGVEVYNDPSFTRKGFKVISSALCRIINKLALKKSILIILTECQSMDTSSWELTVELLRSCEMVTFIFYSRPGRHYAPATGEVYSQLLEHDNIVKIPLEGLSKDETKTCIIKFWEDSKVVSINGIILEDFWHRSGGNPLYIRSLVKSFKESEEWSVTESGELKLRNNKFEIENIFPDLDLQNNIIAQFDRLDDKFQLLLKVVALIGEQFLLDDVLNLLPGIDVELLSDHPTFKNNPHDMDRRSKSRKLGSTDLINIQQTLTHLDRFGFLVQLEGNTRSRIAYAFKNEVIRQCIYSMMMFSQRQKIHLLLAQYYEFLYKKKNRRSLLVPIYEHYKETETTFTHKKIKYLELVCHYYFEGHFMSKAITHYNELLNLYSSMDAKIIPDIQRARWHSDLAIAYLTVFLLEEAEENLKISLDLLKYQKPSNLGRLAMNLSISKYKRLDKVDKTKVDPVQQPTKVTEEPNHGSSIHSSAKVNVSTGAFPSQNSGENDSTALHFTQESDPSLAAVSQLLTPENEEGSRSELTQIVLLRLADLYLQTNRLSLFRSHAKMGLFFSEKYTSTNLHACFHTMLGLIRVIKNDTKVGFKHFDIAESLLTERGKPEIRHIAFLHKYKGLSHFILGHWIESSTEYEYVLHHSQCLGEIDLWILATKMLAMILLQRGLVLQSLKVARRLLTCVKDSDDWKSVLWSNILAVQALLMSTRSEDELIIKSNHVRQTYLNHRDQDIQDRSTHILIMSILAECDIRLKEYASLDEVSRFVLETIPRTQPCDIFSLGGCIHLLKTYFIAAEQKGLKDSSKGLAIKTIKAIKDSFQRSKSFCYSLPVSLLCTALIKILQNSPKIAARILSKATLLPELQRLPYIQAIVTTQHLTFSEKLAPMEGNRKTSNHTPLRGKLNAVDPQ